MHTAGLSQRSEALEIIFVDRTQESGAEPRELFGREARFPKEAENPQSSVRCRRIVSPKGRQETLSQIFIVISSQRYADPSCGTPPVLIETSIHDYSVCEPERLPGEFQGQAVGHP